MAERAYVFADRAVDDEFVRLEEQASFFDPVSRGRLNQLMSARANQVLEVGVGTGSMTRWLAARGHNVLGLDVSDRFFPASRVPGVELMAADVRTVELEPVFDVVYARMVLHHLPERESLVPRMTNWLRPGWPVGR